MQSNMKKLKICLVILCLLPFWAIGLPQSHGANFCMKKIEISSKKYSNHYAFIDDGNFTIVSPYKWHLRVTKSGNKYAYANINGKLIQMHRFIMRAKPSQIIDHKDNNGLNNYMSNLRMCTKHQNNLNRDKSKKTNNKYKGVHYRDDVKKYRAKIEFKGKQIHLGYFKIESEAALAYNNAALRLFGEFARLNII